jgi:hypothetical protein
MMKDNIYTLFVGFQKLGEVKSILEANKFAQSSNLAGALIYLERVVEIVGMCLNQK